MVQLNTHDEIKYPQFRIMRRGREIRAKLARIKSPKYINKLHPHTTLVPKEDWDELLADCEHTSRIVLRESLQKRDVYRKVNNRRMKIVGELYWAGMELGCLIKG